MGSVNSTGSKLEKVLASDLPEHERYFGLENFGNTCYCNSVLQALYFCEPFRQSILQYTYNRKFLNQQLLLSSSSSSSKSTSTSTSTSTSISSTSINNHLFHFDSSLILQPITCSLSSPPASPSPSPSTSISPSAVITAPTTTPTTNHSTNNNIINNENNHISANHLTNTTTFRNNFDPSIIAPPDIERPLSDDDTMLTALADLFSNIAAQKKRSGSVPPKSFVTKLRQENELFSSYMHQDAHEFLNFILNNIVECLHKEEATFRRKYQQSKNLNQYHHRQKKQQQQHQQQQQPNDHNDEHEHEHEPYINNNPHSQYNNNNNNSNSLNPNTATPTTTTTSHVNANNVHNSSSNGQPSSQQKQQQNGLIDQQNNKTTTFTPQLAQDHMYTNTTTHDNINNNENNENSPSKEKGTFVHELFEGQLSNEVRCLCCETVTQRLESFFDLSVDVEQNSSLTACLKSFSSTELLQKQDKFFCDACCSLQEAERRMRIRKLPRILALHLKRFKYVEQLGKFKKLSYRVVFPLELRLCNTSDDAEDPDRLYSLFAVIVHVGSGPNQGHYVSLIKSHGQWLLFDDDCVEPKDESEIQSVYGITQDSVQSTEAGYILFYEQTSSS